MPRDPPPWAIRTAPPRRSSPASTTRSPRRTSTARTSRAIGVGVPGRVDPAEGTVTLAVNLGWRDFPLKAALETRLGRPCIVENDARAAAIGLHERGVLGDFDDLAYLAVGTGIAAGVVLDGTLHRGARGLAGEIGHAIADRDGPVCACGQHGCLEAFVSGPAIARRAHAATATDVFAAAAERRRPRRGPRRRRRPPTGLGGPPARHDLRRRAGRHRRWRVPRRRHRSREPIHRELARLRAASPSAAELLPADVVEILPPEAEAGAWGAVTIAAAHIGLEPVRGSGPSHGWREVGHVRES